MTIIPVTAVTFWVLVAGGQITMIFTAMIGIVINAYVTSAKIKAFGSDIRRFEISLKSRPD